MMNIQKPAVAEHSEDRVQDNPFVGKTIVVTGKVEPYTRDGINHMIESLGAHAGSSVSKKTDYLVCGENAGSKLQKAAELGAVSVLARRYVNCYARDQYVSSPFYVYISKSKNGQQYLDSLGGAATTSRKEKYVEGAFLVERAALHTAGALPEKEE